MDFFEQQDAARRRTSRLVAYYVLAVALIILAIYATALAIFGGSAVHSVHAGGLATLWDSQLFLIVAGVTLAIVTSGTVYKISQLASGGATVAELLGGRRVLKDTADAAERRLLNVVEEMALAAGTPVPEVFLLPDEQGINAFAAGFTPHDAVIAVTGGCLQRLSRDELQGVIAHEFSHILNGDMRLNIRLVGVLNGILVIALVGYGILRTVGRSTGAVSRGRRKGGAGPILLLGLALMVIGYIGVFFAKLIKSAVSRQREFLADASAVQFTRNPDGIGGALKKILAWSSGSRLDNEHAEEASHFFFANGLRESFLNVFATHPPLSERIRRIEPSFDGTVPVGAPPAAPRVNPHAQPRPAASYAMDPADVMSQIGAPQAEHLAYAAQIVAGLPAAVQAAVRVPAQAPSVLYALLLSTEEGVRTTQLAYLAQHAGGPVYEQTRQLAPVAAALGQESRLPAADLAVSALRQNPPADIQSFMQNMDALVMADQKIDLFEYALHRMTQRRLAPALGKAPKMSIRYQDVRDVVGPCRTVLSCLAYWGAADADAAKAALAQATPALDGAISLDLAPQGECQLSDLDQALNALREAAPAVRKKVLAACVTCIGADGRVTVEEAELIRIVGDALDCPTPPILPAAA